MNIELRQVSKRFGKFQALSEVSLTIPGGSRVVLVGPNGSGKSTLIRAILGLIECQGEVLLDGASPFDHRSRLAGSIAYVPQTAPMLGATVRELTAAIAMLRGLAAGQIEQEAAALELDLNAVRDRPFRHLSGGMKQKLLAAIAFAARPRLLILDEPTASLDEEARQLFWHRLRERSEQATVLLCSHRIEESAGFAGRVLALREGLLVRDELIASAGPESDRAAAVPLAAPGSHNHPQILQLKFREPRHA